MFVVERRSERAFRSLFAQRGILLGGEELASLLFGLGDFECALSGDRLLPQGGQRQSGSSKGKQCSAFHGRYPLAYNILHPVPQVTLTNTAKAVKGP